VKAKRRTRIVATLNLTFVNRHQARSQLILNGNGRKVNGIQVHVSIAER